MGGTTATNLGPLQISPIKGRKSGVVTPSSSPSPSPNTTLSAISTSTTKKKVSSAKSSSSSSGKNNIKSCRCVKSKCLKLYCECFSSGILCGAHCKCVNCNNNKTEVNGKIKSAKESYLIRKPSAFTKPPKAPGQSCACRTNRCLKKYCDCFRNKVGCGPKCTCSDCLNISLKQMRLKKKKP